MVIDHKRENFIGISLVVKTINTTTRPREKDNQTQRGRELGGFTQTRIYIGKGRRIIWTSEFSTFYIKILYKKYQVSIKMILMLTDRCYHWKLFKKRIVCLL